MNQRTPHTDHQLTFTHSIVLRSQILSIFALFSPEFFVGFFSGKWRNTLVTFLFSRARALTSHSMSSYIAALLIKSKMSALELLPDDDDEEDAMLSAGDAHLDEDADDVMTAEIDDVIAAV